MRVFSFFTLLFFGLSISFAETTKEEQRLFDFGRDAMKDNLYEIAESKFQTLLMQFPQSEFREEAALLLARARLNQGHWNDAIQLLESQLPTTSPEWQDSYYFFIGEAQSKGEMTEAVYKTYEGLVHRFPKSKYLMDAKYGMAKALLQQQKFEAAQEILRILQKEGRGELSAKASLSLGISLFMQKKYDQASELLTRLARDERKNTIGFEALYALGEMDLEQKRNNAAYSRFETLTKSDHPAAQSVAPSAFFRMAQIDASGNNWATAITHFEQAFYKSEDYSFRLKCVNELTRSYPKDRAEELTTKLKEWADKNAKTHLGEELFLEVCTVWQQAGKRDQAIKAFQNFFKKYPESSLRGQAHYQLGWIFFDDKKYESAAAEFQEAADFAEQVQNPDLLVDAWFSLGNLNFERQQYPAAAAAYTQASQAKGADFIKSERALYQAAHSHFRAKNIPEVLKLAALHGTQFTNGKLAPDFLLLVAEANRQLGNIPKTADTYKTLLDKYPASPQAANAWVYYSESLFSLGKYKEIPDVIQSFLEKNPNHELIPRALLNRARTLERLGKVDKAVEEFDSLVSNYLKTSIGAEAQFWLGSYYFRQKNYAEAQRRFELVRKNSLVPSFVPEATYFAAQAAYRLQNKKDAERLIQNLKDEHPSSPWTFDALFLYGDILTEQGKHEGALLIFNDLIKKYQEAATPHFVERIFEVCGRRGQCLRQLGKNEEALDSFNMIRNSPKADAALRNEAYVELGKTYENMGDLTRAEENYLAPIYDRNPQSTLPADREFYWVCKGTFEAVRLLEEQKKWKKAALVLKHRLIESNLPCRKEAEERLKKLQSEHADANGLP